jgi:hypothetical protein
MNEWLQWHLDARTGPKRILCLDGGGVRGLISLGILQRMEDTLKSRLAHPEAFRLAHYFDLIAGTSTGSIIATALALGWRVADIRSLYDEICPAAFKVRARGIFKPVFDHNSVERKLKEVLGHEQLQSDKLLTGLMICAKRIDTGSPWVLTNNPASKYWTSDDKSHKPNKEFELWMLVRASTAAPLYFEPIEVTITEKGEVYPEQKGLFIDGAVGGFNNPSLQALKVATLQAYGFNWQTGANNLFLVSVGTGWWRERRDVQHLNSLWNWQKATEALAAMIQDTVLHNITAMQAISTPRKPWFINTELGEMRGQRVIKEEVLSYQRYDALLEHENVCKVCNIPHPSSPKAKLLVEALRQIGNTDEENLRHLYALGYSVGKVASPGLDGIEPEDFPPAFDPPFMQGSAHQLA